MEKVDFNIEYAHIYVNEGFNHEHQRAARFLNTKAKELKERGGSYSGVVLFDDYNPSEWLVSEEEFICSLSREKAKPDFVAYEARLVPLVKGVLELVDKKDAKGVRRYIESRRRIPCSFLIVVWHFFRLGLINDRGIDIYRPLKSQNKRPFVGESLITVLPDRFRSVEEKARGVIGRSQFGDALDRLEYHFF